MGRISSVKFEFVKGVEVQSSRTGEQVSLMFEEIQPEERKIVLITMPVESAEKASMLLSESANNDRPSCCQADAIMAVECLAFLKTIEIRMKLLERFEHPDSPIGQLMKITPADAELVKGILEAIVGRIRDWSA